MRKKIHCEEVNKKGFDELPIKAIREMIGFIEPMHHNKKPILTWEVTMCQDGSGYTARTQFEATVIASLEEIKALLMKKVR